MILNCDCYMAILKTIYLYAKKELGHLRMLSTKCLQIIHMNKQDLTLNNVQWLIGYKTKQ